MGNLQSCATITRYSIIQGEGKCGIVMKKLIASVLLVLVVMCGSASAAEIVPLPPVIDIVKPNSGVSVEPARFSGKWSGMWDNGCPVIIVVENVDYLGHGIVVFAQGTWPWNGRGKNPSSPFWKRLQAQFIAEKMSFKRVGNFGDPIFYEAYIHAQDGTMRVNRTDTYGQTSQNLAKLTKTE